MNTPVEQAPAKINLGLKVLGRRPDGYHDILSVFQTLDLCDGLRFEPLAAGRTELVCNAPGVPAGPENLAWRAAEALRRATGATHGVRIGLEKRIPAGAGLGGGSSDAAATLRGLNRMWGLGLPGERLAELAAGLGSDVPFFLTRGTAVVTGRGERIRPILWEGDFRYVLVYPKFQVSTGWAYRNLKIALTETSGYISFLNSVKESGRVCPADLFAHLENDFLPLLETAYPEVGQILDALAASGALARSVSGSGSTLYGVFEAEGQALEAAAALRARGYPVYLCRPGL